MKTILILLLVSSCSIPKVYRATIGFSSNNTSYKTAPKDGDDRNLCVTNVNTSIDNPEKCGDGFKEDKGVSIFEPWVEFRPHYFRSSSLGYSYFFAFNRSKATILDYPTVSEETDIIIERVSLNPIIYYNIGDKYLTSSGGHSARIGLGAALSYVYNFQMQRKGTDENYTESNPFKSGISAFFEWNISWFTLRFEHSSVIYESKKFDGIDSDKLSIDNNKLSTYYSYYF